MPPVLGLEYESAKLDDGTFAVYDVPIFEETVDDRDPGDEFHYTKDWLEKAVGRHKELAKKGHYKPIILDHHEGSKSKRNVGFISNLQIKEEDGVAVVYADLMRIPEDVYDEMCEGRIPYRSVEIDLDDERPCFSALALMESQDPYCEFGNLNVKRVEFRRGSTTAMFCRLGNRKLRVIYGYKNKERKAMSKKRYGQKPTQRRRRKFMMDEESQVVAILAADSGVSPSDIDVMEIEHLGASDYKVSFVLMGSTYSMVVDLSTGQVSRSIPFSKPTQRRRRKFAEGEEKANLVEVVGVLEACEFDIKKSVEKVMALKGKNFAEARDLLIQAIDMIANYREMLAAVEEAGMVEEFSKARAAVKLFTRGRRRARFGQEITIGFKDEKEKEEDEEKKPYDDEEPVEGDIVEDEPMMGEGEYVAKEEFDDLQAKFDSMAEMLASLQASVDEILAGKPQEPAPPLGEDEGGEGDEEDEPEGGKKMRRRTRKKSSAINDRLQRIEAFIKEKEHSEKVESLIQDLRKAGADFNEFEVRESARQFSKMSEKAFRRYAKSLLINAKAPAHLSELKGGSEDKVIMQYSDDPGLYQVAKEADDYYTQNQRYFSKKGITRAMWIEGETIKHKRRTRNGR